MVGFGCTSGGWSVSDYYQPSLPDYVFGMDDARQANVHPETNLPYPADWDCDVQPRFRTLSSP